MSEGTQLFYANPSVEAVFERIKARLDEREEDLRTKPDFNEMLRAQEAVQTLRWVLALPEEILLERKRDQEQKQTFEYEEID